MINFDRTCAAFASVNLSENGRELKIFRANELEVLEKDFFYLFFEFKNFKEKNGYLRWPESTFTSTEFTYSWLDEWKNAQTGAKLMSLVGLEVIFHWKMLNQNEWINLPMIDEYLRKNQAPVYVFDTCLAKIRPYLIP